MKDLTVFLLTHNRPLYVLEMIESVFNQDCQDFSFIVSDNSDNSDTYNVLKDHNYLEKMTYLNKNNDVDRYKDAFEHINTTYFMVLHDDDILMPTMISKLYDQIVNNEEYLAVACNAFFMFDNKISRKTFFSKRKDIVLTSGGDLAYQFSQNCSIAPFPSYIYNKKCMSCFPWDYPAGNYSDAVWIASIANLGKIKWISEPLMYYRRHSSQESMSNIIHVNDMKLSACFMKLAGSNYDGVKRFRADKLYLQLCNRYKRNRRLTVFIMRQLSVVFVIYPRRYFEFFLRLVYYQLLFIRIFLSRRNKTGN